MRDKTEWSELVKYGVCQIAGAEQLAIRNSFSWAMEPLTKLDSLCGTGDEGIGTGTYCSFHSNALMPKLFGFSSMCFKEKI